MGHENDEEITLFDTSTKADEIGEYADDERPSWISKYGGYDHFEFITSSAQLQSDLCPADYIFVSGKLLPMKHQIDFYKFPVMQTDCSGQSEDVRRRVSESSSALNPTFPSRSSGIKRQVVRNYSWKSDGSSVSSNSSNMHDLDRNYSNKSNRTSSGTPRTRWKSFIYGMGMVKYPLEMELRDIKHRQSRRGRPASSLFLATPDLADRRRGASWGLIKALSCKDHTSTSVNASFVLMPNV